MSKTNQENSDPQSGILNYLVKQNRPYSVIDIFNNLHKAYGKTLVTKTLETLVAEGSVKEKTYGKQKVYVANQENIAVGNKDELATMDVEIDKLTKENASLQKDVGQLASTHKSLQANMTLDEAKSQLASVAKECAGLANKLSAVRGGQASITKEEAEKIKKQWTAKVGLWRKRKRMATDILDSILENYPKPKKTLFDDIGIETDEDCKVSMPK